MIKTTTKTLIDSQTIAKKLKAIADQITKDLISQHNDTDSTPQLTIIPIMTGAIIFLADLIRLIPLKAQIHLVTITSYPGTATTSQGAKLGDLNHLPHDLKDQNVLIIDDILDSGATLTLAKQLVQKKHPQSVKTCVLLRKFRDNKPIAPFNADYTCFDIPDEFVVGYGLDYDDYYRNLPDICILQNP